MKKAIYVLATAVLGVFTVAASAGANGCRLPFDQQGKLEVVIQNDGCTIEIKASTHLQNACAELFELTINDGVSLSQIGVLVFGDGGSCSVATETDAEGDAEVKGDCKTAGHTKIKLKTTSCQPK